MDNEAKETYIYLGFKNARCMSSATTRSAQCESGDTGVLSDANSENQNDTGILKNHGNHVLYHVVCNNGRQNFIRYCHFSIFIVISRCKF